MQTNWFWNERIFGFLKASALGWVLILSQAFGIIADMDDRRHSCPKSEQCIKLSADCWKCQFPTCKYGESVNVSCTPLRGIPCQGEQSFSVLTSCRFCYQADPLVHICDPVSNCSVIAPPPKNLVTTTCTVKSDIVCMGQRRFHKRVPCRWTTGHYKWSTALILSITLGGFGVDRFYLGLWRSGLGKLFSFGGLGVWTIIDVILIATGYIRPGDDSLYLY